MNFKIAALGGFVVITAGLLIWLLTSGAPAPDSTDIALEDSEGQLAGHGTNSDGPKVRRDRSEAEEPDEEAVEKIDLPSALPKLNLKPADSPVEPVVEMPVGAIAEVVRPRDPQPAEEEARVMQLAVATGKRAYDKRHAEKARDWQRDKARLMREKG